MVTGGMGMDSKMTQYILNLQDRIHTDEEYQRLMDEYTYRNEQLLDQLKTMNPEQRSAVWDYLGLMIELHFKILEHTMS